MLDQLLNAFSLSTAEKQIFKELQKRGAQPASAIARSAEMPRNTVRGILDKMVTIGLVSRGKRANAHIYSSETKERLVRTLKQQLEVSSAEIEQRIELVEKLGDILTPKWPSLRRPKVNFYEGEDGLKRVYEDTLTSRSGVRAWASFDANREALPQYFPSYYKRRAKRNIRMRSIHPATKLARQHCLENNKRELRESVLVPEKRFNIRPEVQIYDHKVNIVSWHDKMGIIIESEEIATGMRSIFDLTYFAAKSLYGEIR